MRVLETERLVLDEFEPDRDAAFLLQLLNEPSFIANIRDSGTRTPEDARRYAEQGPVASYARFGYGLWRVALRESGESIGMCGLLKRDALPDPDLGFAYLASRQRAGFGREAASAVLDHAHTALSLPTVLAVVAPHNAPSISLLQGLGFREAGDAPEPEGTRLFVHEG